MKRRVILALEKSKCCRNKEVVGHVKGQHAIPTTHHPSLTMHYSALGMPLKADGFADESFPDLLSVVSIVQ